MKYIQTVLCILLSTALLAGCAVIPREPAAPATTPTEVTPQTTAPINTEAPTATSMVLPGVSVEKAIRYYSEVCLNAEFVNSGDPTLLQKWAAVTAGNTGAATLAASSKIFLTVLTALQLIPALLAAAVLMRGSRMVEALDADPFAEETVALAENISRFCGTVIRVSLVAAVVCNLVQMAFFSRIANVDVSVYLPVLPLALAVVLQQLCRYFRRAKAVSDDNDTII